MSTHPGRISYVDHYAGTLRPLTLLLTTGNAMVGAKYRPVASIDGRQYVVVWGEVSFDVPAERNVHVSVHLEGEILGQAASLVLPPGADPVAFRYETHYGSGVGTLTPVGPPPAVR